MGFSKGDANVLSKDGKGDREFHWFFGAFFLFLMIKVGKKRKGGGKQKKIKIDKK